MGAGEDNGARLQGGYNRGYNSFTPGGIDIRSIPYENKNENLYKAAVQGWDAAKASSEVPLFEFDMEGFIQSNQEMLSRFDQQTKDNSARYESQLAEQARQEEENRLIQGRSDRDTAYGSYIDAAGTATDYVNSQIKAEQSNARLIGVDAAVLTDEMKSSRINNYFATLWGEGDQSSLDRLMSEFGNPDGFEGFSVTRGDASEFKGVEGEKSVSKSRGAKKKTLLSDEDNSLGGGTSILGA